MVDRAFCPEENKRKKTLFRKEVLEIESSRLCSVQVRHLTVVESRAVVSACRVRDSCVTQLQSFHALNAEGR